MARSRPRPCGAAVAPAQGELHRPGTVLRQPEDKGYTTHTVDGRTYSPSGGRAARTGCGQGGPASVDRSCNGSTDEVLVGMVDTAMLDQRQLRLLADQVAKARAKGGGKNNADDLGGVGAASLVLEAWVWVGLNLLRIRNPHVHMTSWVLVLVASLAMPLLDALDHGDHHPGRAAAGAPAPDHLWPTDVPLPDTAGAAFPPDVGAALATPDAPHQSAINAIAINAINRHHPRTINWWTLATAIYLIVAGLLLLRLGHRHRPGFLAAGPRRKVDRRASFDDSLLDPPTTANVRVSPIICGPVTFGSTILLPRYTEWTHKRRAQRPTRALTSPTEI